MSNLRRSVLATLLTGAMLTGGRAHATAFIDPLDIAATADAVATHEPLIAVATAGNRLVAVGLRGLVLYSDNNGQAWKQAAVPVQVDLTSVRFLSPQEGWATGHNGVVLHTRDGGVNWTRQFDGRDSPSLVAVYQKRVDQGDATAAPFVAALKLNTQDGPILPYLDILFENAQDGYAVGSYGMLIMSHDGGGTWTPWLDHVDNPEALNLNALAEIDGSLYIAGEKGKVYRLDRNTGRFVTLDTGYAGSLFGIVGNKQILIAFGMLGHAFRSTDQGQHWQGIPNAVPATISGGVITADGRPVLATQAGVLLTGDAAGAALKPVVIKTGYPLSGAAISGANSVALVGVGGVSVAQLPYPP